MAKLAVLLIAFGGYLAIGWFAARRLRRRRPLALAAYVLLPVLLVGPPVREARRLEITHPVVHVQGLPPAFSALRIALITDVHRGPFMSAARVRQMVDAVNAEQPDVIALTGDYIHRSRSYIPSAWQELSRLRAPLGVYAVLGNHDYWESGELSVAAMQRAGISNLTNAHVTLRRGGERLFVAGVDDAWAGNPSLEQALGSIPGDGVALVLSHNPDYIERASDRRARLWLSGHTHGGQVCLPGGRPIVHSSRCGGRYVAGLAACGAAQIYVSRGVGTVTPPVRWNCPAEVPILELQP